MGNMNWTVSSNYSTSCQSNGAVKFTTLAIAKGSLKNANDTEFQAKNDRFEFNLNPKSHVDSNGEGMISFADKVQYFTFVVNKNEQLKIPIYVFKEKHKNGAYQYQISQNKAGRVEGQLANIDGSKNDFANSLFGLLSFLKKPQAIV